MGTNDSSLGCRLVSVSGRRILTGKLYREVNISNMVDRGTTSNEACSTRASVPARDRTFRTIICTLAGSSTGIVSSFSRMSTVNRHVMRNNTMFGNSYLVSSSTLGGVSRLNTLTPLRGPTRILTVGTYVGAFNGRGPRITIFSASFRRAVPRRICVFSLPCRCCRGCRIHGCNTRNADRSFISGHLTRIVNGSHGSLGVVAYRLNGNYSVATIGSNGYCSASVNFAPLSNFVVNAHANALSPSTLAFVTRGRGLSPTSVGHVYGGRSNILNISNVSGSGHSIGTTTTGNGRHTRLTISVRHCRVLGFINSCVTSVGNISTVTFANNVNRGSVRVHTCIYRGLGCVNIRLSGRTGGRGNRRVGVSATSDGISICVVPAGRRLTVTHRALRVVSGWKYFV